MRPLPIPQIPVETWAVARAAFPDGCLAIRLRDQLGPVFQNADFVAAFAHRGGPSTPPGMLALVSVLQFAERLTDRQAADAVRGRIDWKYALSLPLTDPGFDFTVLSQFRDRLITAGMEQRILDLVLQRCGELGLLRAGGRVRTDATHVLACIRDLNRLEFVTETMRCALEALAAAAPEWLLAAGAVGPVWVRRYGARADSYRLPKGQAERAAFGQQVGIDGYRLLDLIDSPSTPDWLAAVPAVAVLRRAWDQQYRRDGKQVAWRDKKDLPPGTERLVTPHDIDARCGVKRTTIWHGYKTHYTETCDQEAPHLITAVATVPAPIDDSRRISGIHTELAAAGQSPTEHFVDAGYTSAALILEAAEAGIDLVGPVPAAGGRQAHAGNGYALADFEIDWDRQQATCPQGKTSTCWIDTRIDGQPRIHVDFYGVGCHTCPAKTACTTARYRGLTLHPREQQEALVRRRAEQDSAEWKTRYNIRAGIEATISQAVRHCDARRTRYRGLPKVRLEQVLIATAIDLCRLDAWWTGTPLGPTRTTHYAHLELALTA
jgi:transposase